MSKATHHLVILSGQGDTDIKLVTAEQYAWINSPGQSGGSWIEKDPANPTRGDDDEDEVLHCTSGSYDNDRALYADGPAFDSTKEAFTFAKKHKFVISKDEYHGYIY